MTSCEDPYIGDESIIRPPPAKKLRMTSAEASRATLSLPTLNVIQLPSPTTGRASPLDGIGRVRGGLCWAEPSERHSIAVAPAAARALSTRRRPARGDRFIASPRRSLRLRLLEHLARDPEAVDCRRHAAVDGGLEEDLADLVLGDAVRERAAHVRLQLVRSVQRRQHREVQHAPDLARQTRPAPDGAPAVLGDKLLQRPRELGYGRERCVDVPIAENRPTRLFADRKQRLVHAVA